ncbi:hypothetical protein JYU34_013274, partial [Plutella xylostella]
VRSEELWKRDGAGVLRRLNAAPPGDVTSPRVTGPVGVEAADAVKYTWIRAEDAPTVGVTALIVPASAVGVYGRRNVCWSESGTE